MPPTKRAPPDSYHHGDLKESALREARRLLSRPTRRDFTLPEVAQALGVSHAALYRHFSGKAGVLAALAIEGYQRFDAAVSKSSKGLSGRALLRATAVAYCGFVRAEPALFRAMFDPLLRDKSKFPELESAAARSFSTLGLIVRELQHTPRLPPALLGAAIWSALHGMAVLESEAWLPGRTGLTPSDLERRLPELLADFLFNGISSLGEV